MTEATGTDDYLDAFMNGFEFVLLAMHGRVADLDEPERERVERFLEDYERIVASYRARREHPPHATKESGFGVPLRIVSARVAELSN